MIAVTPVRSGSDWEAFLRLPWKIYEDYPQWVPPIIAHQRRDLDRRTGFFFRDGFGSTAEFFLARSGSEVIGRVAAIRNGRHLQRHRDGVGFFGFFESVNDNSVAGKLLDAAEAWLADNDLRICRGPASFSIYDPCGVVIAGGDRRPTVGMAFTPPYYADLLESCGYRKGRDLLAFHVELKELAPTLRQLEREIPKDRPDGIEIRQVNRDDEIEEAEIFSRILTSAWARNWGALPVIPEDFLHAKREMGPFFDEKLAQIALVHGEPVGIFLAIADPWEIFHRLDGRLGIRGIWKIAREKRSIRHFRVIVLGVLPEYRNLPIAHLMLRKILEHRKDFPNMKTIEFSWILEENERMRSVAESCGGKALQTFRIYDKYL